MKVNYQVKFRFKGRTFQKTFSDLKACKRGFWITSSRQGKDTQYFIMEHQIEWIRMDKSG